MDLLDRLNIQQKIMACFSLGFLLCLAMLGITLNRMVAEDAMNEAHGAALRQMQQADASLVSMERLLKKDFLRLSKNEEFRLGSGLTVYSEQEGNENGILEMDPEAKGGFELRAYQMLRDFAKEHEDVTAALTYGMRDGGYVQYPAVARENNFDPRKLYWYRDGMAAGESGLLFVSKPFQGADGKAVIGFYSLVWTMNEEPLGVLGLQLDLVSLLDMTLPEKAGLEDGWMVLDGEDSILVDEKHPDALFRKIADANLGDLSLMGQKKEGIHRIRLGDEEMYASIYLSGTTGLKYIRLLKADDVMSGASDVRLALLVFFLLAAAMSFFGSRLLAKKITAPFRAMEEKAEAIGAGRLMEAGQLSESDDEVGRLSLAFQEMAGGLRQRLEGIRGKSWEIAGISGQLTEDIETCRKASENALKQAEAMTSAGKEQTQTVKEVASQLAELAESLGLASESVREIGKVTHQLGRRTLDGREGLKKAGEELENAQARMAATAETKADLDKKALQATELIKSIGEMSEQLNLLALNAAVESARAGSGKERSKFTAVAEEVRQLSEQSSKAARKAALILSALQQEAQQTAQSLKETGDAVSSGRKSILQREEELIQLSRQLEEIDGILGKAASAVQSLEGSEKRVKAAAEQVEWGARKSADAAESAAKAARGQADMIGKIGKSSRDITAAAEKLRERTEGFEL